MNDELKSYIHIKNRWLKVSEVWFCNTATLPGTDLLVAQQWPDKFYLNNVVEKNTLIIDLTQPLTNIFDAFKKDTRNLVRRCDTRDGMYFKIVKRPSLQDIKFFADFYDQFANLKNQESLSIPYLEAVADAGMLVLSWAFLGNEPLVGHGYISTPSRVRLLQSASLFRTSSDSAYRNLVGRANRWLHWKDIEEFAQNGYKIYDLGGWYAAQEDKEKLKINSFKEEFGGVNKVEYNGMMPLTRLGKFYQLVQSCKRPIIRLIKKRIY